MMDDNYQGYRPRAMQDYLRYNKWSFSKKACHEAVKRMRRTNPSTGKKESVEELSKDKVDDMLSKYGIKLDNNRGYDYVYVANVGKTKYLKSSISDEQHLALYVKDVIDDDENPGGNVFRKWLMDQAVKGDPVEFGDLLDD